MGEYETLAIWVSVAPFAAIALIVCFAMFFRHRKRQQTHETLRKALEHGNGSPELLRAVDELTNSDLRKGVVSVGIGIAFVLYGLFDDFNTDTMAIALFPLAVGGAYLFLRYHRDRARSR